MVLKISHGNSTGPDSNEPGSNATQSPSSGKPVLPSDADKRRLSAMQALLDGNSIADIAARCDKLPGQIRVDVRALLLKIARFYSNTPTGDFLGANATVRGLQKYTAEWQRSLNLYLHQFDDQDGIEHDTDIRPESPIQYLGLEPRILNCLLDDGITRVEVLLGMTSQQLRQVPGMGPASVVSLCDTLSTHGVSLTRRHGG